MVAQVAIPIATAVGEFAAPYLLRKAGEIGLTRFIQVYGSAAATAIGIQKTQPVDLQTEKILGMPVSHITGQGEVYDDIDYSYIDEDKENDEVPTKTTEEKLTEPTEPEPPEDPDVGADLAAEAAIHTTKKLLEDKELDISQQTKNLTAKIKNKITTWEDHFPTIEEATKAAKDVGGTLREFEEGLIEKKITFKKLGNLGGQYFKVLYDGKEIAELAPLEEKYKGLKEYNIKFMGEIEASDTGTGLAESKALVKKYIVEGLLDKSEPSRTPGLYWEPLRKTFQEATFDKEGNYVEFPEPAHTEKELEELVEQVNKNK